MPTSSRRRSRATPRRSSAAPARSRSRSRVAETSTVPPVRADDEAAGADRDHPGDLELELFRQRSLLAILTARLREVATSLERSKSLDFGRLRRALDVHHRVLVELHRATETLLADALSRVPDAARALAVCRKDADAATEFEREIEPRLRSDGTPTADRAAALAALLRAEAERIDRHQAWEEERLHGKVAAWLPERRRAALLAAIRAFDAERVDAEIALISWASQAHPSAD